MRGPGNRAAFILDLEGFERDPGGLAGPADNYPPCNLERIRDAAEGRDSLRLVLAVAGFAPDQLEITVAGDQLCISGEQGREGETRHFLYRGIAARRFRRCFRLGHGLEVQGADLRDGLLRIDLAVQVLGRLSRTIVIGARDA